MVAPTGLYYYAHLLTDASNNQYYQLWVASGDTSGPDVTTQLLLTSLDPVLPGGYITEILFGYHTAQSDSAGRIVLLAECSSVPNPAANDPSVISTSIVVGVPV